MTELSAIPQHLLRRTPDKADFQPKLSEDERRGVLALHMLGVKADVLALAFDLNRRTVNHMVNPTSLHYRPARAERKRLGDAKFIEKYATEQMRQRVLSVSDRPETKDRKANPHERRKAGIHVVKPEQCAYSHRLEVQYHADRDPPGWYYRDLDSKTPDDWFHNGEASLASSQACLAMAEVELTDD